MEIVGILENEYCLGAENNRKETSQWNGRAIHLLAEKDSSSRKIISVMQKSYGEAGFVGGYSEEKGGYVEGKVSIYWGESEPSPSSSAPKAEESEPEQNASE